MKLIQKYFLLLIAALALNCSINTPAHGSHIIGGELIYRCLDPSTNYYQFWVKLYRSCKVDNFGVPYSIYFDSTIYVSLYDSTENLILQFDMSLPPTDTLDNKTYNICLFSPPDVCVEEAVYTRKQFLPKPPSPNMSYSMTYQRCCRNAGIINIITPGSQGAAWNLNLPDSAHAYCNSSPYFKNYPPTIICLDDTMWYDHSAIDPDGDSLSYALCEAKTISTFNGGGGIQNPALPLSYYYNVLYNAPYSYQYPINCSGPGGDSLKIDPVTGLLTIKPTQVGLWVVAVCVYEWRNGVLINEHKRDFQFNVAPCLMSPNSNILYEPDACDPRIVQFNYEGNPVANWSWDFGLSGITTDTSSLENPIYAYPDYNSTYPVSLVVNKGYVCIDTVDLDIGIPPELNADFDFNKVCLFDTVSLFDSSTTNNYSGPITNWDWTFTNGSLDSGADIQHQFQENVLEQYVQLIVTTVMGCKDTALKMVDFFPLPVVDAGSDKWITVGESTQLGASGADGYTWSPPDGLSDWSVWDPVASPLVTTEYEVIGTTAGNTCNDRDTVIVNVVDADVSIPNAFSPNGDGENDVLYLLSVGVSELIEFKIFNRWGQVVFETSDLKAGWDGTLNGEPQEIGNYAYYYKAKTIDDAVKESNGDIALIR